MTSWKAQLIDPCHGWPIAADDHTVFHSYQLKTRRSGSNGYSITNTGQLRNGKHCLVQRILVPVASGFGVNSLIPWSPPWRILALMNSGCSGGNRGFDPVLDVCTYSPVRWVYIRGIFMWSFEVSETRPYKTAFVFFILYLEGSSLASKVITQTWISMLLNSNTWNWK